MHTELDEDEDLLVLPENPPPVEGWRLLELLQAKAQQERIGLEETAKRIGISRSYLSSLRYGQRKVSSLGREILDKCAEFLGMPLAGVLMAAEVIYPTDFVGGSRERACNDPLKTCSGDTLKGVSHERCDGRRDQAVDGQAQERAGAGNHPGEEDSGGGCQAIRPAAIGAGRLG